MFNSLLGMLTKGAKMMVKQLYLTLFLAVSAGNKRYLVLYKPHFADLVTSYNSLSNLRMQSPKLPSTSAGYNHLRQDIQGARTYTPYIMAQQKSHPGHAHGGLLLIIGVILSSGNKSIYRM